MVDVKDVIGCCVFVGVFSFVLGSVVRSPFKEVVIWSELVVR